MQYDSLFLLVDGPGGTERRWEFLCHAGVGVSRIAPDPVLNIGVLEIFSRRRRLDSDLDWKGLDAIFGSPLLDP